MYVLRFCRRRLRMNGLTLWWRLAWTNAAKFSASACELRRGLRDEVAPMSGELLLDMSIVRVCVAGMLDRLRNKERLCCWCWVLRIN